MPKKDDIKILKTDPVGSATDSFHSEKSPKDIEMGLVGSSDNICPKCNLKFNLKDGKFCTNCGAERAAKKACKKCGTDDHEENAEFCYGCGANLNE